MNPELYEQVLQALEKRRLRLAIAESLTGGLVASNFIAIPGASKVVLGSVVAYQNSLKHDLLSVANNLLLAKGAVSPEVAIAMALGVRERLALASNLELDRVIAISTTGVAGPGEQDGVAAGTVFVAVAGPGSEPLVGSYSFDGDRAAIRTAATNSVAELLWDYLSH